MKTGPAILLFIMAMLVSIPATDAHASFSARKVKAARKKAERKKNPHDTGIGAINVEKEMVRFFAKGARRANTENEERKYKRKIVGSLRKIKKLRKKWNKYSPRGRWLITYVDDDTEFEIHFFHHNPKTDFIHAEYINPDTSEVLTYLQGYQKFNAFSVKGFANYYGYFYLIGSIGPKKAPVSGMSGYFVFEELLSQPDPPFSKFVGYRFRSPF